MAKGALRESCYVYDADGNRVAKGTITSWSCDPSVNGILTSNNETDYVLGPGGEQVTDLAQDSNGTMNSPLSGVDPQGLSWCGDEDGSSGAARKSRKRPTLVVGKKANGKYQFDPVKQ